MEEKEADQAQEEPDYINLKALRQQLQSQPEALRLFPNVMGYASTRYNVKLCWSNNRQ